MDDLSRFRDTYLAECEELLRDLETHLSALHDGTADSECLNSIFRAVHSIKAGAGMFKFTELVDFSHEFEALLDNMRDGRVEVTAERVDLLFKASDVLADLVSAAAEGSEPPTAAANALAKDLAAITSTAKTVPEASTPDQTARGGGGTSAEQSGQPGETVCYRIDFYPAAELFRHANEPLLLIRELKTLGEVEVEVDLSRLPDLQQIEPEDAYLGWTIKLRSDCGQDAVSEVFEFVEDDCRLDIHIDTNDSDSLAPSDDTGASSGRRNAADGPDRKQADRAAEEGQAAKGGPGVRISSIRVDLDRVDRLVNMVGELVITQSMLSQQADDLPSDRLIQFTRGREELATHTRELQESVMAIRMQPVKSVFARMPRLVREVTDKLGKRARLVTIGEETEVDKTVIEEISDPITHMIRNSLDHGLEPPEEREAAGKPADGTITLSAEHRAGRIVINIRDDGRGIDHAAVLARAKERGLVAPGAALAPDEIEDLLFEPGFSTAATVTDISGRGVGLDVVRRNIQGLGGRVSVSSSPGSGTCFTMTLPLTLAVMDGMIVVVGGEKFVIPTTNIIESMRPGSDQVNRLPSGDELVEVRGDYLPLFYIARAFGIEGAVDDPSRGLVVLAETERKGKVGLVVDELLGQQQVVIKSLEDNYDPVPGIAAATILGNGLVAPILDIEGLQSMSQTLASPPPGLAAAMTGDIRRPDMIASIEQPERNQWT